MGGIRRVAKRTSEEHQNLTTGALAFDDASKSAQSWVELWCYHKAVAINKERSQVSRRELFKSVPETLKPIVIKYGKIDEQSRSLQRNSKNKTKRSKY